MKGFILHSSFCRILLLVVASAVCGAAMNKIRNKIRNKYLDVLQ